MFERAESLREKEKGVHMGKLSKDNLRKTVYYLKKNGLKNTLYAVAERMQKQDVDSYTYEPVAEEVLQKQRECTWNNPVTFSILVPLYHTPEKYFKEMVESVLAQTYPYFQLILLDASKDGALCKVLEGISRDDRICYQKLTENKGIAENTNAGIPSVKGEYIALLDHDDLLTADALYEMALAIEGEKKRGIELEMLYSDEDKCDGEAIKYYEPHYKKDFDTELLLTNNYICHFTAIKREVFEALKLRGEYNGAQDFDLVLRVADLFWDRQEVIKHIPKVLYHWRCHISSTAANPASKAYAYEAGKRAVEAFVEKRGWKARVEHLKHLGFYKVVYEEYVTRQRPEIGAVGGSLLDKKGKIVGGMQDTQGKVTFEGLKYGFSGYMNRAVLTQEAEVLDVRCLCISQACEEIFLESLQEMQVAIVNGKFTSLCADKANAIDWLALNQKVCKDLKEAGYKLLWNPEWVEKLSC